MKKSETAVESKVETAYNIKETKDVRGIGHMYVLETFTIQDGKVVKIETTEPSYLPIVMSKFERTILAKNLL